MKIIRNLDPPQRSFFLFGPRGTGKSTWLRAHFPGSLWFNLLRSHELLELTRDPESFRRRVEGLPAGSWVIVDEVQRAPELLNEVHDLIATHGDDRFRFALTGSSARKLKRSGVNLLAGRAVRRNFFPVTGRELLENRISFSVRDLLKWGTLPRIFAESTDADRIDFLESYVDTYLKEEIKEEGLIRKLDPFLRFLGIASQLNGQVLNLETLAREAAVSRSTVQGYFDVLLDTLIGFRLEALQPRFRIKETAHPKFYFFDPGVTRVLAGTHRNEMSAQEKGALFETLVLGELRAWLESTRSGQSLAYWSVPSGGEVDILVCEGKTPVLAIEVKASERYRSEMSHTLRMLMDEGKVKRGWVVLLDSEGPSVSQRDGQVEVLSYTEFCRRLWSQGV
jgi:predicted AAA+ superfamily ATPase